MAHQSTRRGPAFYLLALFFALFVAFLYGPMLIIFLLSFQGPTGGLTFPLRGVSTHWFSDFGGRAATAISAAPSGARSCSASCRC